MPRPSSRRVVPQKRNVRDRWFLPPGTAHLAIPLPTLSALTYDPPGLTGEELRVALWLVADWWWPGGLSREINATVIATRVGMHRPNVHRALDGLEAKGVLLVHRGGRGKATTISIEPLIRMGRDLASNGVSSGYSGRGRKAKPSARLGEAKSKEYQPDTPKPVSDTPSSIKVEPRVVPSDLLPSDLTRPASEVGGQSSSGSNGHANGNGMSASEQQLRRQHINEVLRPFIEAEQQRPPGGKP